MDVRAFPYNLGLDKNNSNRQVLNIVTQCDEHYAQHLSVMLLSLLEQNQNYVVNAFVMVPEDTQKRTLCKIRHSISDFSSNLHFLKMNPNLVESLKVFGHVTYATYYKLFIGEVLPQGLQKVIFLDPDIVVRGRLDELWNFCHEDSIVGAVTDSFVEANPQIKSTLGLDPGEPYFNAGVLLIDLNRWRQARVGSEAVAFAHCHADRISFADQCPLNWVLRNRWISLPESWNLQTSMVVESRYGFMDYSKVAKQRGTAARIIHFSGDSKPWHYMNNHPFKRDYLAYLSRTDWRNYRYPDYTLRNFTRRNVYRFAPFLYRLRATMVSNKHRRADH
jgi:lipopolysaccharide biosynthesis glycosyltransferase